jgi:hypothetical protein
MDRFHAVIAKFKPYFQPFDLHHALLALPGMAVCLIYGLMTQDLLDAAIAAAAALAVGMGVRRFNKVRAMALAIGLMSVASFLGSAFGHIFPIYVLMACVGAGLCAGLSLIEGDLWWVVLESCIALFISSHFAYGFDAAEHRAYVVLFAGLGQMMLILGLDFVVPRKYPITPLSNAPKPDMRQMLIYGVIAALSVGVAIMVAYGFRLEKAYWAPLTALIVLKPKYHLTKQRWFERMLGTIGGCLLANLLIWALPPSPYIAVGLALIFVGLAYALLKARYAVFTTMISGAILMLLYIGHASAIDGAEQRIMATTIGGVAALGVMWLASRTAAGDYVK